MFCPRCGAQMKNNQRYCMKCGALNYDHPDNKRMKNLMSEEEFEKSNKEYQENLTKPADVVEFAGQKYETKTKNKKSYVDTRTALILLLVFTVALALLLYFYFYFSALMIVVACLFYFLFGFFTIALSCVYMKGGYSGFTPIIPFYNNFAYCDMAVGSGWMFLLLFVPIVNFFYSLYLNYQFGKSFGKSGWLTVFFPFIMIPYIAFSDTAIYQGQGLQYSSFVEKGKRRNPNISAFVYAVIVFALSISIFIPVSTSAKYKLLPRDMEKVLEKVHEDVDSGYYTCDNGDINTSPGEYYIKFSDVNDLLDFQLLPLRSPFNGEKLKGYVKVVFTSTESKAHYTYSITVTDGKLGIRNGKEDSYYSVKKVTDVSLPEGAVICKK